MMNKTIPIVIGITGHRAINDEDIQSLKLVVKKQIEDIVLMCPNTPIKLMSSLAKGADQLCGEVALELGIGLIAALPMEASDYQKDFEGEDLNKFNYLLNKAEKNFVVPYTEDTNELSRDYCYRQASIYLAEHCHVLIALWDGSDPKLGGCGTAETVDFVINHTYKDDNRCIKKDSGYVIHIKTPRDDNNVDVGKIKEIGNRQAYLDSLTKLDQMNKEKNSPDELSIINGKKYHNILKLLSILGMMIAILFLLYDEALMINLIIMLGFILVFMFITYKLATKSKCHEKYIEYRVLAECIRIQEHLNHLNSKFEVADFLDWNRRHDTNWIYKAMKSYSIFSEKDNNEDIKKDWLIEQRDYHSKSVLKTKKLIDRNNRIVNTSLVLSISMYIFTLLFEYVISKKFVMNIELVRTIIKIVLGSLSALSIFAANYYGKLSLQRVYEDHIKMCELFNKSIDYVDKNGVNDSFIKELINEELSENSNWCSYEKDNEINLTI